MSRHSKGGRSRRSIKLPPMRPKIHPSASAGVGAGPLAGPGGGLPGLQTPSGQSPGGLTADASQNSTAGSDDTSELA